jgi:hypothetical protein
MSRSSRFTLVRRIFFFSAVPFYSLVSSWLVKSLFCLSSQVGASGEVDVDVDVAVPTEMATRRCVVWVDILHDLLIRFLSVVAPAFGPPPALWSAKPMDGSRSFGQLIWVAGSGSQVDSRRSRQTFFLAWEILQTEYYSRLKLRSTRVVCTTWLGPRHIVPTQPSYNPWQRPREPNID